MTYSPCFHLVDHGMVVTDQVWEEVCTAAARGTGTRMACRTMALEWSHVADTDDGVVARSAGCDEEQ